MSTLPLIEEAGAARIRLKQQDTLTKPSSIHRDEARWWYPHMLWFNAIACEQLKRNRVRASERQMHRIMSSQSVRRQRALLKCKAKETLLIYRGSLRRCVRVHISSVQRGWRSHFISHFCTERREFNSTRFYVRVRAIASWELEDHSHRCVIHSYIIYLNHELARRSL